MRTVWSPATRPKLSSFAAPRSSINSIAARRAAAANASRQLAVCDVFAFFLGPVLAAAAFADVSWKEQKRKEWERRFAEINAQLEDLRAREVEVWRRIQFHSVRHGVLEHRRMYSTAVATPVPDSQPVVGDQVNVHLFENTDWTELDANWDRNPVPIRRLGSNRPAPELESLGDLPMSSPLIRYEKLLALRLALRMLLHICAGSDDLRVREIRKKRPNVSAQDIGGVVVRLQAVTDELDSADLRQAASRRKRLFRHNSPESEADDEQWRAELHELGRLCRKNQIDIATLVDRLSKLLLPADRKPPGPEFYARVAMLFSLNNFPGLAKYAISALECTSYVLSPNDICLMLNHSSHSRDYKAYDWVIHNLTDAKGLLSTESSRWKWVRMDGILLPMPADEHPGLLRGLLRSALNFNDPKTAEAYVRHLPRDGPMRGFAIKAFLQYYAKVGDWTEGKKWLHEAHWWTSMRKNVNHPGLRAVLVRVFDFLIAFRMDEDFQALLKSVAWAGIEPPEIDPRARESSGRLLHIVQRWREEINLKHTYGGRYASLDRVMLTFENLLKYLPADDNIPLHLKESEPADDRPNVDGGDKEVHVESPTPGQLTVHSKDSAPSQPILPLEGPTAEVESVKGISNQSTIPDVSNPDSLPAEPPATVSRSDIEKLSKLNSLQREEFQAIHDKQRVVIEAQEQKLKDLQRTVADLKTLVGTSAKDQQAAAVVQHEQALQLREQEDKIRLLENEVRRWRQAQPTIPVPPPPYSDQDGVSEQLRYYLTPAFAGEHPLTVPEVISWAELAAQSERPNTNLPKRATSDAHRRRIFEFITTHVKSGRLSADILRAEAEAAEARARAFQARQDDCAEAGINLAKKSADDERQRKPESLAFGWNICSPLSLPSTAVKRPSSNDSASPAAVSFVGTSRRLYSSTCRSRIQCSPVQSSRATSPSSSQNKIRKVSLGETASEALPKDAQVSSESAFLRGADYRKHGFRRFDSAPLVRKLITTDPLDHSRTRHKPAIHKVPFNNTKSADQENPPIHKVHNTNDGATPASALPRAPRRIAAPPSDTSQQQEPPALRIRKVSNDSLPVHNIPLETIRLQKVPHLTLRIRHIPKEPLPRDPDVGHRTVYRRKMLRKVAINNPASSRRTGDPQGHGNNRKGAPLRVRLKYAHLNKETFQMHEHLRFVHLKKGTKAEREAGEEKLDALGEWDPKMWEL